jgi:hypothetical protein
MAQAKTRTVRQLLGEVGNDRGRFNEQRVLDTVQSLGLPWIVSVRFATRSEDREGKDIVCETAEGPLFLQVKSSRAGRRGHDSVRHAALIRCIVVVSDPLVLRNRVRSALEELRSIVRRIRSRK